jgi:hypothetical protein
MTPRPATPRHSSRRARLTFHQDIHAAVAARVQLVLVVGSIAAVPDYVQQQWQFAPPFDDHLDVNAALPRDGL